MHYKIKILMVVLWRIECSRVIDYNHSADYFNTAAYHLLADYNRTTSLPEVDYCAEIGVCNEGVHVMCTHFNPERKMGPLCTGTKNVYITPEYAKIFLGLLNGIRSRAARGRITGMDNLPLPRAYGILELEWDPELSMFAQLWANQCITSFDTCRASETFHDPGQIAGLTRFDDDWIPINSRERFNYTGFSLEKVTYGIHSAMRSWFSTKEYIHPNHILDANYQWPHHLCQNIMMEIIYSKVTHVGCGLSVFTEYAYDPDDIHQTHHVVRIVCNLSHRLCSTEKDRIYATKASLGLGYTDRCGCPKGYDETEDCLCHKNGRKLPNSYKKKKECKPTVVVLPIFTVENAPPSKLITEIKYDETKRQMANSGKICNEDHTQEVKARASMFLKPSVFKLPTRKLKKPKTTQNKVVRKDVTPRRDFSNIRKLVSNYLNKKRRYNVTKSNIIDVATIIKDLPLKYPNATKEHFREFKRRRIVRDSFNKSNLDIQLSNDESNNLMSLLNKLEEEAKNVQVALNKKRLLEQKIRKIYDTFVDNALLPRKSKYIIDKNMHYKDIVENEKLHKYEEQFDKIRKKFSDAIVPDNNFLSKRPRKNDFNENSMELGFKYRNTKNIPRRHDLDEVIEILNRTTSDLNLLRSEDDVLSLHRRKFYQTKIDDLEKKLRDFRNYRNRRRNMHADQHFRRMLPTYRELQQKRASQT